jgi:hypothetical protein
MAKVVITATARSQTQASSVLQYGIYFHSARRLITNSSATLSRGLRDIVGDMRHLHDGSQQVTGDFIAQYI